MISQAARIEQKTVLYLMHKAAAASSRTRKAPSPASPDTRHVWARRYLSWRHLKGDGIEIGALHQPLQIYGRAKVRYVDRFSAEHLRTHYPELAKYDLIDPDIVDDGEKLEKIQDGSLDFLIANHFIEHCEDPIGAIASHLEKLRKGGILYMAVPMKEMTFDRERELTSIEHLLRDHREGPAWSRRGHFLEWARFVQKKPEGEIEEAARGLMEINYSIHYHVWNHESFEGFLAMLMKDLRFPFRILKGVRWHYSQFESIWILKKI